MLPRRCSGELYRILSIPPNATQADVKRAYHSMALQLHPDKTGGVTTEQFQRVQEANSILADPESRKLYDTFGRSAMRNFEQYDMRDIAVNMAASVRFFRLAAFIAFLFALALFSFSVLLVVRLDTHRHMSWMVAFSPLLCFAVGVALLGVITTLTAIKRRSKMLFLVSLFMLLVPIECFIVPAALQRYLSPIPALVVAVGIVVAYTIFGTIPMVHHLSRFRASQEDTIVNLSDKSLFIFMALFNFQNALYVVFFILLALRVSSKSYRHLNFYIVFAPLFVRVMISIVQTIVEAHMEHRATKTSRKRFLWDLTVALAIYSLFFYMPIILSAVKCQMEINEDRTFARAIVVMWPLNVLAAILLIMALVVFVTAFCCLHLTSDGFADMEGGNDDHSNSAHVFETQRLQP